LGSIALAQRLATAGFNRQQCLGRAVGVFAQLRARRASLDDHHAHAVRDHVVQLVRDASTLLGSRNAQAQLAFVLQTDRALFEHVCAKLAVAHGIAHQPHAKPAHQLQRPRRHRRCRVG